MLNKTLNVGVIGLRMGETHAKGVKEVGESQFLLNEEGHKSPPPACMPSATSTRPGRRKWAGDWAPPMSTPTTRT